MDVCSLLFTGALIMGVVVIIIIIPRKYREAVNATKASLEQQGWTVSSSSREGAAGGQGGKVVALKSNKKPMDREHYLDVTQRGIIRAVKASRFGAPDAVAVAAAAAGNEHSSSSSSSSLHEESVAGSHLTALHSLLRHRHHHHHEHRGEAPVDGAGGGGGVSDSGSETASIDVSVTVSASPEERRHRRHHRDLRRLKHLARRHGD